MILVYITNPTKEHAKKVAKHLLEQRLIACANIVKTESLYNWEGELKDEKEYVLWAKSEAAQYEDIKKEVGRIHEYDTPAIIKLDADSNQHYMDWVRKEVGLHESMG